MGEKTNKDKFEKLLQQIKIAIEFIDTEYKEQPTDMLKLIRKRYYDAMDLIENNSITSLKKERFFIKGGTRAYLESSSNYTNPMLEEMFKVEKLLDDILH